MKTECKKISALELSELKKTTKVVELKYDTSLTLTNKQIENMLVQLRGKYLTLDEKQKNNLVVEEFVMEFQEWRLYYKYYENAIKTITSIDCTDDIFNLTLRLNRIAGREVAGEITHEKSLMLIKEEFANK